MGQDERHYDVNKLNVIFACASLVLLFTVMALFMKDYTREWKDYQTQFRAMEVEKARVKLDKENIDLEANAEFKEIEAKLAAAREEFDEKCQLDDKTQADLAEAENQFILVEQDYKLRKAELDAIKYKFEYTKSNAGEGVAALEEQYKKLNQRVSELALDAQVKKERFTTQQARIEQCGDVLKKLEREESRIASQRDLLQRKLSTIDTAEMSFINQIANLVRDLPVLDLANPNNKIEQIVLKDVTDNVNFMNVPKVERCISCHLGVTNPEYENEIQPFKTHPKLDMFVGKNSAHPVEEFGCTVCHGGRARGTSFNGAVHVPRSPQQKAEWEEKYNYHQMELWEDPMVPLPLVESGCFKCHTGESRIKGADKLNLGLSLIEKSGCYACHEIDKYKHWNKPGPDLTKLDTKVSKDWVYRWINDPHSFRHNSMMPAYFNQSNNSDPVSKKRSEQEIHAMIHYLFENAEPFKQAKIPVKGNVSKGQELVEAIGCYACHQIKPNPDTTPTNIDDLRRRHGPNLIGLGTKTSKQWLYNWLKDPKRYHPDTMMPDMRLTNQEAADIAEFLSKDKNSKFASQNVPKVDVNVLNEIVLDYLKKSATDQGSRNQLAKMKLDDKLLFAGEKMIGHYGCYSCHNIKGFDNVKPIGVELTEESSKSIHKFDFGFLHIEHSKQAWFKQKLKDPRSFDQGKIKAPDEKLKMPNFQFKDDEIEAITTALLGFVNTSTVEAKKVPRTPEILIREQGQDLITQFNCRGCHMIEGEGESIAATVEEWLVAYKGKTSNEAATVRESFTPPNLHGIGKKLDPEWLFNFLHEPKQQIRPWMDVRMPTFNFNVSHLNSLIQYFQSIDGDEFPYKFDPDIKMSKEEYKAAEMLFSEDYFGCTQCHVVGNKLPSGSQDSWAPNLALAKTRLQPEWLIEWLKNPSALMPGTKMPTFFDPENYEESGPDDILDGDENEQIRVLRNFLMTLTDTPVKKPTPKKPAPAPAAKKATPPTAAKAQ